MIEASVPTASVLATSFEGTHSAEPAQLLSPSSADNEVVREEPPASELLRRVAVRRSPRIALAAGGALAVMFASELAVAPLKLNDAPPVHEAYRRLAKLPRGVVAEFPFYYERPDFPRHARYMLASTYHWQPLVNGYSDHIPSDFRQIVRPISSSPTGR